MSRNINDQNLTTGEVARYLGVNFRTVIRWIKRGHLKAYQLPGRGDNRILVNDFLEFLTTHKMNIPDELGAKTEEVSKRILIVENELPMAKAIQRILNSESYETKIALEGFQAGSLLPLFRPDLMTLDLSMPGICGIHVLKFVRSLEEIKETKILVISGRTIEELEEAKEAGANDILQKPFENEILIQKVRNLIGTSDFLKRGLHGK